MLSPVVRLDGTELTEEALRRVARQALAQTRAEGVAIALETDGVIVCRARAGHLAPDVGVQLNVGAGLTGECVRRGEVICCDDALSDPRVDPAVFRVLQVRAIVAVPLLANGRVVGVLEALSSQPWAFSKQGCCGLQELTSSILRISGFTSEEERPGREAAITVVPTEEWDATDLPKFKEDGSPAWRSRFGKPALAGAIVLLINVAVIGVLWLLFSISNRQSEGPNSAMAAPAESKNDAAGVEKASQPESVNPAQARVPSRPSPGELALLKKWAEQGNSRAQYRFAKALVAGKGVPRDEIAGYAWYLLSGLMGQSLEDEELNSLGARLKRPELARVRLALGRMFADGVGVPKDDVTAYAWIVVAAALGSREAIVAGEEIESRLRPAQVSEARERARAWLLQHREPAANLRVSEGNASSR